MEVIAAKIVVAILSFVLGWMLASDKARRDKDKLWALIDRQDKIICIFKKRLEEKQGNEQTKAKDKA